MPARSPSMLAACLLAAGALAACSTDDDAPDETTADATADATNALEADTLAEGACQATAMVEVGVYGSDQCAGDPLLVYTLDISQACSGWSRESGRGTVLNSGSRFQCFRDRLCYTQFVQTLACDGDRATDKEVRTDVCLKDQTPGIWVKLVGGTDACPAAPAGFECPVSESFEGNQALAAACTGA